MSKRTKRLNFVLREELYHQIYELARANYTTVSQLLRDAAKTYLKIAEQYRKGGSVIFRDPDGTERDTMILGIYPLANRRR